MCFETFKQDVSRFRLQVLDSFDSIIKTHLSHREKGSIVLIVILYKRDALLLGKRMRVASCTWRT